MKVKQIIEFIRLWFLRFRRIILIYIHDIEIRPTDGELPPINGQRFVVWIACCRRCKRVFAMKFTEEGEKP